MHVLTGSPCPHPFPAVACPLCRGSEAPGRGEALASAAAVAETLAAHAGATELILRDGDLLARPEAIELLQAARQSAKSVELWTGGLMLARPGVAEAVLRAGVTTVAMPLYGDAAESHDWVTGQPGHFQRVIAAFKRVRALGGRTAVIAPVLRPTFRGLPVLVQKSLALDVSAFRFVALPGPDRVAQPLVPSLEMAAPFLRQAALMATTAKRRVSALDVPACLLAERAADLTLGDTMEVAASGADPVAREHGPQCDGCSWRGACGGQAVHTAMRFGWTGLTARTDPVPGRNTAK